MINAKMRNYKYYLYNEKNSHGQRIRSKEPQGEIKMAINIMSQNVQSNILYENAQYIGITHNKTVDDTFVIEYESTLLKVLYVNKIGRFNIVYMAKVN